MEQLLKVTSIPFQAIRFTQNMSPWSARRRWPGTGLFSPATGPLSVPLTSNISIK